MGRFEKAVGLINEGNDLYEAGHYGSALERYTQAISVDPTSAGAYYNRSILHATPGEYGRAEADRLEAVRLDPETASRWEREARAAADAFVDLGNSRVAIRDFEQALS